LLRELLSRVGELKGSETDRFLKFLAILNTLLERKRLGRVIIVGGFAAEIYSGRSYRTGDVDIIVEGGSADIVREVLREFSDFGLRIYLPKIREISEKGIDIVGENYNRRTPSRNPCRFLPSVYCATRRSSDNILGSVEVLGKYGRSE